MISEFDASQFAGQVVMTTATTGNVTIAAGAGVFTDVAAFCHGYASTSGMDLASLLNAAWPAAGTLSVGIDTGGFFYIESDTVDFSIGANAKNAPFGYDVAGHPLVGGVAPFRRTAPSRFRRGIIKLTGGLDITPSAGVQTEMPTTFPRVQSLVTWIRVRGAEGDADDAYDGLTLEDVLPTGSTVVVESDGAISIETPAGEQVSFPSTAIARAFAEAVGFRGAYATGSAVSDLPYDAYSAGPDGRLLATGPHNAPGVLPLRGGELRPMVATDVESAYAGDGTPFAIERYTARGFVFRFSVAGPADGRTYNRADALRSFLTRCVERVTVYPSWGSDAQDTGEMELRRHRGMRRVTVDTPEHDLLYTADADVSALYYGARAGGRLILRLVDDYSRTDEYTGNTDSLQDVELTLYVDPSEHPEAADDV